MNQTEYAAHRGVSSSYISRMCKLGKIPRDRNGKIDPVVADATLAALADPNKAGVVAYHAERRDGDLGANADLPFGDSSEPESFSDSKRRDAKAAADLREMERDRIKGDLIDRRTYAKGCVDLGAAMGKELSG